MTTPAHTPATAQTAWPVFSFFKAPVTTTVSHRTVNLWQIYNAIRGPYYQPQTEALRALVSLQREGRADKNEPKRYKSLHFDYACFSGTFARRTDSALLQHSSLLCLDFDHVDTWCAARSPLADTLDHPDPEAIRGVYGLRYALLNDDYFDTQLLFRSPSGDGLKWVVEIDLTHGTHAQYFEALSHYLQATYGVSVDPSGRNLSRACYLPHDPDAVINPKYLNEDEK